MKPIIGVTSTQSGKDFIIHSDNTMAISAAGGLPFVLPILSDGIDIHEIADNLDGLYLTGGNDVNPLHYGKEPHPELGEITPERDKFEIALTKRMLAIGKPILGVCRGLQVLNVAAGGTLYQDIYSQIEDDLLQHNQIAPKGHGSHFVHIFQGSSLHRLIGKKQMLVNSRHHQAVCKLADTLKVTATASDGIIEAMEGQEQFVLGVQWHPENMAANNDEDSLRIYRGFIDACKTTLVNKGKKDKVEELLIE